MKSGQNDMAATVWITSKPIDAFLHSKWDAGFKFLPVPFEDFEFYLPSTLTSKDYPELIPGSGGADARRANGSRGVQLAEIV